MIPNNGVTRMPIEAQQKEADAIAKRIAELEDELARLRKIHHDRLSWINARR